MTKHGQLLLPCSFLLVALMGCTHTQMKTVTDHDQVKSTVSTILPQVKNCYLNGLREKNQLKGKMVTSFQVNAQGKVSRCEIKSSDLQNKNVESCICQKITKTTFPPAPKGKMAKVDYPFIFSNKE